MPGLSLCLAIALSSQVSAETREPIDPGAEVKKPAEPMPSWSSELMDTAATTRFQLITRVTFAQGDSIFSGDSAWSYEGRVQLAVSDSVALSGVLPIGLTARQASTTPFVGNVAVGMTLGGNLTSGPGPKWRAGGGLDAYLPTAPETVDPVVAVDRSLVAAIRAYEPQLYLPKTLSFRLRAHAEMAIDIVEAELEVGIVPGATLGKQKDFIFLLAAAGRASAAVTPNVEPFLEVACAPQLGGTGEVSPPLMITPGVRFHIADVFDPSLFVSFNFVAPSAVVFGVDLASVVRPSKGPKKPRERDADDFLGDF